MTDRQTREVNIRVAKAERSRTPYASLYRLSVETIPQSDLVSEIFSSKVATMTIPDDVISDVIRPGSTIREDHIDTPCRGTLC